MGCTGLCGRNDQRETRKGSIRAGQKRNCSVRNLYKCIEIFIMDHVSATVNDNIYSYLMETTNIVYSEQIIMHLVRMIYAI